MGSPSQSIEEYAGLAERIRRGEQAAEEEFARHFTPKIHVLALVRTRDPEAARDLVQDTLIAALEGLRNGRIKDLDKVAGFVYGTARNVVNSFLRARSRRPPEEPILPEHAVVDPGAELQSSDRMALARAALEKLEATDRKILLMTLVDGEKPGEIAHRLDLNPEVVRQRKSRAVKKVMEIMRGMSRRQAP